ncbi:phosphodiester glycosidase family protein [Qipengyuania oceanensis]|uniref:phosphodiester glycosidase family protein n=1 Tax=Qipengyuania oceanensis TaxID=1463597 RepID=UPI00301C80A3
MKRIFLLTLLSLVACDQQQEAGNPVIRHDISGDTVRDVTGASKKAAPAPSESPSAAFASACTPHFFEDVLLTDCVAEPGKHVISTALGPKGGAPYRSLKAYAGAVEAGSVAFAVNAGMFDKEGKPIGYFVQGGDRLKELNRADGSGNFHMKPNGVFYGSSGNWHVKTSEDFFSSVRDRPAFGTQSGPMLVIGGKLHPEFQDDGPSKAIRNGVGVDAQGRAHFVISEAPVSFGKFARFYRDELKVANALYLDGSVSALWDPAKNRIDGGAPIGPMLVVTRKD